MTYFVQLLVNAVALGSIYALTAIGYSMVYGILELINFAHGSVYMFGAFLFYIFNQMLQLPWYTAMLLAIVCAGVLGVIYEKLTVLPIRRAGLPKFAGLICLTGVSYIITNGMFLAMGSESRLYPTFFAGETFSVGAITISYIQILSTGIGVLILVLLLLLINKTKIGLGMRTIAQNSEAAYLMGISVNDVISFTFFLGSALAAVSGIFACMTFRSVDISIGNSMAIKAFAATVLGGIGNL